MSAFRYHPYLQLQQHRPVQIPHNFYNQQLLLPPGIREGTSDNDDQSSANRGILTALLERYNFPQCQKQHDLRYFPTTESLLMHYLKKKMEDPRNFRVDPFIAEVILYDFHPQELLDGKEEKRGYFYTLMTNDHGRSHRCRTAKNGYWKNTTMKTVANHQNVIIGLKRNFVFYNGKSPEGTKSEYSMHEYKFNKDETQRIITNRDNHMPMMDDVWVVCEVFKSRRKVTKISEQDIVDFTNACLKDGYDFLNNSFGSSNASS